MATTAPIIEHFEIRDRWTDKVQLEADRLREVLHYDCDTGIFTYRVRAANRVKIGDVAGSVNNQGYRQIRVDGRGYKAHRLAVMYVTGKWPTDLVDHIDGDRSNNRYANLREATRSQNLANSKVLRRGKAAVKGVRLCENGRWSARIQKDLKATFLGYFQSEDDAAAAYARSANDLFGDFAKGAQL